jgi:biopolymer transport protein ExbB
MKKFFALLMLSGVLTFGYSTQAFAQEEAAASTEQVAQEATEGDTTAQEAQADTTAAAATEQTAQEETAAMLDEEMPVEEQSFHQAVKDKFIEGGPAFMGVVLLCLIIGMAIAIERIIALNLATTNTSKLLNKVEDALNTSGIEGAKEVTKSTRGPVASIFTQGLMRYSEGIEMVEKSVISYGSVEMGRLERGLVWVSLFIALAPMLGFMGTVIGMIAAFDAIEAMGDIQPSAVAGGIKQALLTTVAGLIVAVILQVFYNYLVSKVDSLVNSMEDASISLVDLLVKHKLSK